LETCLLDTVAAILGLTDIRGLGASSAAVNIRLSLLPLSCYIFTQNLHLYLSCLLFTLRGLSPGRTPLGDYRPPHPCVFCPGMITGRAWNQRPWFQVERQQRKRPITDHWRWKGAYCGGSATMTVRLIIMLRPTNA